MRKMLSKTIPLATINDGVTLAILIIPRVSDSLNPTGVQSVELISAKELHMRQFLSTPVRILAALLLTITIGGVVAAQTAEPNATPDATAIATAETTAEPNIGRQDFTVDLGDFQTPAEITYPLGATGPLPTVVLIAGSGPADMDFTLFSPDGSGKVVSHIFRDIANDLPQHGYAVVRYNKHYVTAANQVNWAKFTALDMNQMLTDAGKVVSAIQSNPLVDAKQLYVYGWSEGSAIAAALTGESPAQFAGLIVQGPVTQPWRALIEEQFDDYGIPYLRTFAPDGKITADVIRQAAAGNGGLVAKSILNLLVTSNIQQDAITLNPAFDTNKDGAISIADELPAGIKTTFDASFAPGGTFAIYAEKALPSLVDQVSKLTLPILILQGERDANVQPTGALDLAGKLAAAGNHQFHVILYPTLGHTLGEVPSAMEDTFPPMAAQPLADMVTWLNKLTGLNPVGEATATPAP